MVDENVSDGATINVAPLVQEMLNEERLVFIAVA